MQATRVPWPAATALALAMSVLTLAEPAGARLATPGLQCRQILLADTSGGFDEPSSPPPSADVASPPANAASPHRLPFPAHMVPAGPPVRTAVVVEGQDFFREYVTTESRSSYNRGRRSVYYVPVTRQQSLQFDTASLRAYIRERLRLVPRLVMVEGAEAELVLRASFSGDGDQIRATFTLVDTSGVILAEQTGRGDMPFFTADNMSEAAAKRAREQFDKHADALLQAAGDYLVKKGVPAP